MRKPDGSEFLALETRRKVCVSRLQGCGTGWNVESLEDRGDQVGLTGLVDRQDMSAPCSRSENLPTSGVVLWAAVLCPQ